jgi:hypothetical protein
MAARERDSDENGGKLMSATQLKRRLTTLLDTLPEPKLAVVYDFAQFLAEREWRSGWMNAQSQSTAYQEWVGEDNDIYDEAFANADPTR